MNETRINELVEKLEGLKSYHLAYISWQNMMVDDLDLLKAVTLASTCKPKEKNDEVKFSWDNEIIDAIRKKDYDLVIKLVTKKFS